MTEEIKRRGRPPQKPQENSPMTEEFIDPKIKASGDDGQGSQAETVKEMTFAEVMAWNRSNAEKMAPLPKKQYKKPRKFIRI